MKVNHFKVLLMLLPCFFFHIDAGAQNIRGDTIYVDENSVVAIVFPSRVNEAKLVPIDGQDNLYNANEMGKTNTISVIAKKKGVIDQGLNIAEGRRNHFLILSYKEGSPAHTVDWSAIRKLSRRAEEVKKGVIRLLDEANSLYDQAKNNISSQVLWKEVDSIYKRLVNVVEPGDAGVVNSRLEESGKQIEAIKNKAYADAMKEGQDHLILKKYREARNDYQNALAHKPKDLQALKNINLVDSVWAKDYVDKGDEANKVKNYILAKTNYQQALDIKADYPYLQNKLKQAKADAAPQIYDIERKKGDQAMKAFDIPEATRAYNAALSVRPDDSYIKNQVKKLIVEENKIKQEEEKETEYQAVLATAKGLAEKASNKQEYELAIKEYQRASKMIPSRMFPWKKIDELTKIMKGISAK